MLNPNNNRLNYGSILYPPNNYELDFAIGTTYSLDLDALVGSSIALGLSQETDSNLRETIKIPLSNNIESYFQEQCPPVDPPIPLCHKSWQ